MKKHGMARLFAGAGLVVSVLAISEGAQAAPAGTQSATTEAAACAALYSVPVNVGPEPLSACQWDMRAIGATSDGSYAVNRGRGVLVGDIDTGIDLTNTDIMPNVDLATSCVFLYADTPTADPAEQVTRRRLLEQAGATGLCRPRHAHGGHDRRADQRHGCVRRRAGGDRSRAQGRDRCRATSSPSRSSTRSRYAGDQHLDVVNMSFFADPWLFNCRNDDEQKAIVQAISAAARYAQQRGVVLVAAAGNDGIDLNHPVTDEISPDYPPGAAVTRPVNNSCVVLPTEIPGVVVVTATGAQNLLVLVLDVRQRRRRHCARSARGSRRRRSTPTVGASCRTVLLDGRRPRT